MKESNKCVQCHPVQVVLGFIGKKDKKAMRDKLENRATSWSLLQFLH